MKRVLIPAALMMLAGCAGGDTKKYAYPSAFNYPAEYAVPGDTAANLPVAPPMPQSAGAIYREGSGGLALFQDQKALNPGDVLSVTLVEATTATSSATTTATKENSNETSLSLFGNPVTANGLDIGDNTISGAHDFSGAGSSAQSNKLTGSISVTVIQRLQNGNLLVRGDKVIRLNQADEFVQIMGIVRRADIAADNTVPSYKLAEVRIAYGGKGPVARSNSMSWLARFFQSPYFPM